MITSDTNYAPSTIARALGWSKRRVLSALALVPATGKTTVSGNLVNAWSIGSLPFAMRSSLEKTAVARGYRSIAALLDTPEERWNPDIPLSKIDPADLAYAARLQTALRSFLIAQSEPLSDLAALKEQVCRDYCQAFGIGSVTPRHVERLAKQVTDRDRGFEEWTRLELYLPVAYKAAKMTAPAAPANSGGRALVEVINSVADPAKPTSDDRAMVWRSAVEAVEERVATGEKMQVAKRAVRDEIMRFAPWMRTGVKGQSWPTSKKPRKRFSRVFLAPPMTRLPHQSGLLPHGRRCQLGPGAEGISSPWKRLRPYRR